MRKIYLIAGPTASGKSACAVKLAKKCGGEIINADALQVYKELQILSARPDEQEMGGIAHHLFGHISVSEHYSTGKWLGQADEKIMEILARGKTPILVGGTGLYFKALTDGLAKIPNPDAAAVKKAQKILDEQGIEALREYAMELDPAASKKVLGHDPQRLLRIVSVAIGTDRPLSQWQKNTKPVLPKHSWHGMVILPEREKLYQRINSRFDKMLENGALEEAHQISKMNLDANMPAMKAIGLKQLLACIKGEMDLAAAIEQAKRDTRRFAKRQYTWIRGNMAGWDYVNSK